VLREDAPAGLRWWYRPRPDLTHATIYRALAPQVLREVFEPVLEVSPGASRGGCC
jgi:hypothetical protein